MPVTIDPVSSNDFSQLNKWFKENQSQMPENISHAFGSLMDSYEKLIANKRQQKDILYQLRMAMGLIQKSEKGSSENKPAGAGH